MPTITLSFTMSGATVLGITLLVVGELHVPDLFAGLGVERDQVRVERRHEQPIAVDREAAVHEAAAHFEVRLRSSWC